MTSKLDVARLQRSLAWGLQNEVSDRELVMMLRPLVRATSAASIEGWACRVQLAERLLRHSPTRASAWEAANLARAVLAQCPPGDLDAAEFVARAFAVQGLALTVLGHYRAARSAYRRALALDPVEPVTAHNLGHLEVVCLGRPRSGLYWLQVAQRQLPDDPEVAASLAHALVAVGQLEAARKVLARLIDDEERIAQLLASWA
ncbi:MAG TPA: tetratricopeptide repeat protein [Polyangiaceae bacterium]|nr:tetratricopeptide repeat protein [Polyangiaceae bacterium]